MAIFVPATQDRRVLRASRWRRHGLLEVGSDSCLPTSLLKLDEDDKPVYLLR
jgi:hypothetical protein